MKTTERDILSTFSELITNMVSVKENVKIEDEPLFEQGHHFKVRVDKADAGKIIGSRGEHIKALQVIFLKVGREMEMPIKITVLEPVEGVRREQLPFVNDPKADVSGIAKVTAELLEAGGFANGSGKVDLQISTDEEQTTFLVKKTPEMDGTHDWESFRASVGKVITAAGRLKGRVIHTEYVTI